MINRLRARAADESGFTLIELLIVIIILGILATIVLFATGTFSSDSKTSACQANAKILNIADAAYAAQHNGNSAGNNAGALSPYLAESVDMNASPHPTYANNKWSC